MMPNVTSSEDVRFEMYHRYKMNGLHRTQRHTYPGDNVQRRMCKRENRILFINFTVQSSISH